MTTTADRVLSVLRLFTLNHPVWSVEEAAARLGLATSTAYRYFHSLVEAGLIVNFTAGRYVIGPAVIELDRQTRHRDPLIQAAATAMAELGEIGVDAAVLLCRIFRFKVMCVDQRIVGIPNFAVSYERGRSMPLFRGAASKIILAHLPTRTVRRLYPTEAATIAQSGLGATWDEFKTTLRAIRSMGIAVTRGELDAGMVGISAPVFDPLGDILGSIGLALGQAQVETEAEQERFIEAVRQAARTATASLRGKAAHQTAAPRQALPAEPGN